MFDERLKPTVADGSPVQVQAGEWQLTEKGPDLVTHLLGDFVVSESQGFQGGIFHQLAQQLPGVQRTVAKGEVLQILRTEGEKLGVPGALPPEIHIGQLGSVPILQVIGVLTPHDNFFPGVLCDFLQGFRF